MYLVFTYRHNMYEREDRLGPEGHGGRHGTILPEWPWPHKGLGRRPQGRGQSAADPVDPGESATRDRVRDEAWSILAIAELF